jgi:hypothetical protein
MNKVVSGIFGISVWWFGVLATGGSRVSDDGDLVPAAKIPKIPIIPRNVRLWRVPRAWRTAAILIGGSDWSAGLVADSHFPSEQLPEPEVFLWSASASVPRRLDFEPLGKRVSQRTQGLERHAARVAV